MKRDDLQGLRGFAIIAVVGFHFFPKIVPNGYIGVDMFFVLSGFLMTMIFGSKTINGDSIKQFYYRRAKRILPLYLLIIFLGCVSIFLLFPSTFISMNMTSAWNSIFLIHNMAEHSDENLYFKMLNQADDIFTHTWSLCVEMQFYIIAPIIFLAHSYFNESLTSALFFLFFIFLSLGNQLIQNDQIAFNNVFCRIWQFLVGSASFYLSEYFASENNKNKKVADKTYEMLLADCETNGENEEEEENDEKIIFKKVEDVQTSRSRENLPFLMVLWTSLILSVFLSFVTFQLHPQFLRISCTFLTGSLIIAGSLVNCNPMNNRSLVYIGDISYCLYLVHWPIFVYVKQFYPDDPKVYIFSISFSLTISIIINEVFEKPYLLYGKRVIFSIILLGYILIIAIVQNQDTIKNYIDHVKYREEAKIVKSVNSFENVTLEEAIALNKFWARNEYQMLIIPNCYPNIKEHGYCEFEKNELTGTEEVFIIGNSFTPNLASLVYKTFGKHARNISKFSYSYCEVLSVESEKRCRVTYNNYLNETFKKIPDVLFILDRPTKLIKPLSGNISSDSIFEEALATLRKYENLVKKKIYLLDPISPPEGNFLSNLAKLLENGKNVTQSMFKTEFRYKNGHRRMVELVKRCKKCELIDISHILYSGNETKNYDEKTKLGYYFDGKHISPFGKELILLEFQRIADSFKM